MRIYLPATSLDLSMPQVSARTAHAVTPALRAVLPEEDLEGLETSACLCAADSSLRLLASAGPHAADRRLVVAAEVAPTIVTPLDRVPEDGAADLAVDPLPGTVAVTAPVPWRDVVALLVDEEQTEPEVRQARLGDDDAFERAAEADLLWYDVTERTALLTELTSA